VLGLIDSYCAFGMVWVWSNCCKKLQFMHSGRSLICCQHLRSRVVRFHVMLLVVLI
jgi:hypothetical protein